MAVTASNTLNWTIAGSQDAAQRTYASIKQAIANHPNLSDKSMEVFLQGSYANSTNIRSDSDVDIVVMSGETYYFDVDHLSWQEKQAFDQARIPATYLPQHLRSDILSAMQTYYGADRVEEHDKCIRVLKRDGYVDADVVPAFQYRLYRRFGGFGGEYAEGTVLFPVRGGRIVNYPKEHKKNGETKNQLTSSNFKPTVRQMKHLKRHAVSQGLLDPKDAPGYLLECLTFNAPNHIFGSHDHSRLSSVLDWLSGANYNQLMAVDNIHTLFGTDPGGFSPTKTRSVVDILGRQVI